MPSFSIPIEQLPLPDEVGLARSEALCTRLMERILAHPEQRMRFDHYMDAVLMEPGLGYYAVSDQTIGADGDFTTAADASFVFAWAIAQQCRQLLEEMGGGDIIELGPGTGRLAANIITVLAHEGGLPDHYSLFEPAERLQQEQVKTIGSLDAGLQQKIGWINAPPGEPWRGIILGHEVLDALPVRRFSKLEDKVWHESGVTIAEGRLQTLNWAADHELIHQLEAIEADIGQELPPGYRSEINLNMDLLMRNWSEQLTHGAVLWMDYGHARESYYQPQRDDGTLRCHYRHHVHRDPFLYPGLQDITASVDFTLLAENGQCMGLELAGFTPYAHGLIASGVLELPAWVRKQIDPALLARELQWLLMPDNMGEDFKLIGFQRGIDTHWNSFAQRDFSSRLGRGKASVRHRG